MANTNPATAGPNGDGSKSLAPESKVGNLVNGAVTAVALYLGDWLAELDVTPLPDALEPLAVGGVATLLGLLASYLKKNRRTVR